MENSSSVITLQHIKLFLHAPRIMYVDVKYKYLQRKKKVTLKNAHKKINCSNLDSNSPIEISGKKDKTIK